MNAREAMAELQAAPKFGNQVELLNIVERELDGMRAALADLTFRDTNGDYCARYREDADLTDIVKPYLETPK